MVQPTARPPFPGIKPEDLTDKNGNFDAGTIAEGISRALRLHFEDFRRTPTKEEIASLQTLILNHGNRHMVPASPGGEDPIDISNLFDAKGVRDAATSLATPDKPGRVKLRGDLSGTAQAPQVKSIRGVAIDPTGAADTEVLTFNAATGTFEPAAGGGGGGAPTAAEYLVGALHAGLSAERLVTDTATVAWDLATPGQAKANVASVPGHTHGPGDITGLPWDIGEGGTGQTTQTAAFDALSPTTTKGDVIASDGSDNVRLPVGSDGQVLTADAAQATGLKWATPSGGGGGGNVGSTTVDFGAFPGASDAFVDVTGQGSIAAESIVQAWMQPLATADHSADEHMVETLKVYAGNIVAGDGFTIYVFNSSETNEPLTPRGMNPDVRISGSVQGAMNPSSGGQGTRIYGAWRVAWRWS